VKYKHPEIAMRAIRLTKWHSHLPGLSNHSIGSFVQLDKFSPCFL